MLIRMVPDVAIKRVHCRSRRFLPRDRPQLASHSATPFQPVSPILDGLSNHLIGVADIGVPRGSPRTTCTWRKPDGLVFRTRGARGHTCDFWLRLAARRGRWGERIIQRPNDTIRNRPTVLEDICCCGLECVTESLIFGAPASLRTRHRSPKPATGPRGTSARRQSTLFPSKYPPRSHGSLRQIPAISPIATAAGQQWREPSWPRGAQAPSRANWSNAVSHEALL